MKKRNLELIKSAIPTGVEVTDKELERLYIKMCKKNYGQKWLEPDSIIVENFAWFLKNETIGF